MTPDEPSADPSPDPDALEAELADLDAAEVSLRKWLLW